jgi:hypothetical protein
VALERLAVVGAVVAEDLAGPVQPAAVAHQPVPVPVADLVPEVAEQRAVGLAHRDAPLLAPRIVGLGQAMVIRPLSWPVITRGPPSGASARTSKASPSSGSSARVTSGRRRRSSV